jgi:hypothetical protein
MPMHINAITNFEVLPFFAPSQPFFHSFDFLFCRSLIIMMLTKNVLAAVFSLGVLVAALPTDSVALSESSTAAPTDL